MWYSGTPGYYGQFRLSRLKVHIFSLKLTRLIRTPVNMDNRHFCVPSDKLLIHRLPRFTDTGCISLYAHCQFSVFPLSQLCARFVEIMYPVQIMTDFYGLKRFYYQNSLAKWCDMFDLSVFPPVFDPCSIVFCLLCLHQSFTFLVI